MTDVHGSPSLDLDTRSAIVAAGCKPCATRPRRHVPWFAVARSRVPHQAYPVHQVFPVYTLHQAPQVHRSVSTSAVTEGGMPRVAQLSRGTAESLEQLTIPVIRAGRGPLQSSQRRAQATSRTGVAPRLRRSEHRDKPIVHGTALLVRAHVLARPVVATELRRGSPRGKQLVDRHNRENASTRGAACALSCPGSRSCSALSSEALRGRYEPRWASFQVMKVTNSAARPCRSARAASR